MTNREAFKKLKAIKNKYVNDSVIRGLLFAANDCDNLTQLIPLFDLPVKDENKLNLYLDRIIKGEPLQYVIGKTQFLDWTIEVDNNVLIPRVETEELAANVLKILNDFKNEKDINVADVCTGSGCLAIAIKSRYPNFKVMATDISNNALNVARKNALNYCLDIDFKQGDLIEPLLSEKNKIDILISNPPYIEDETTIDEQVYKHEPHLALLAKPKWKYYERIFQTHRLYMNKHFMMFFEIGEDMEDDLTNLININFDDVSFVFKKDIYGKKRFLFITGKVDGDTIKES